MKKICTVSKSVAVTAGIIDLNSNTKVGRPEKDSKPDSMEYYVSGDPWVSVDCRKEAEVSLGCFVLATNDLDENQLSA